MCPPVFLVNLIPVLIEPVHLFLRLFEAVPVCLYLRLDLPDLRLAHMLLSMILEHCIQLALSLLDPLAHHKPRLLQLPVLRLVLVVSRTHSFQLGQDHVVNQVRVLLDQTLESPNLTDDLLKLSVTLTEQEVFVLVRRRQVTQQNLLVQVQTQLH